MTDNTRVKRLGKTSIDGAAPETARYTLWDDTLKGFGLVVAPTGRKTFVVRYRAGGGRRGTLRQMKVGTYGALTADEARRAATRILARVELGEDPQAEKSAEREELTISELCDRYMREGVATKKASTVKIDHIRIDRHIKPLIGDLKCGAVTKNDVQKMIRDIAGGKVLTPENPRAKGGKSAATRSATLLSAIYTFAIDAKLAMNNPVKGVKRFKDNKRERFLSPAELGALGDQLAAMEGEGWDAEPLNIIRLLALTGCRKNEIARLKWTEVDAARAMLRLEDSKTGAKPVPLGAAALSLLVGLPGSNGVFVFPDRRATDQPHKGVDHTWAIVKKRANLPGLRLHDLRHSFASVGLDGGAALPLIGKLLGHADVASTARYAHLANDPVRAAADAISNRIAAAMRGQSAEVVQLKGSAQ